MGKNLRNDFMTEITKIEGTEILEDGRFISLGIRKIEVLVKDLRREYWPKNLLWLEQYQRRQCPSNGQKKKC